MITLKRNILFQVLFVILVSINFTKAVASNQCNEFYTESDSWQQVTAVFSNQTGQEKKFKSLGNMMRVRIGEKQPFDAIFLGRMIGVDGKAEIAFLKTDGTNEILSIPETPGLRTIDSDGRVLASNELQPQLLSFPQRAWICPAVACFNSFRLLNESKPTIGNGKLAEEMKNVDNRLVFLTELVFELFGQGQPVTPKIIDGKVKELKERYNVETWGQGQSFDIGYPTFADPNISAADKIEKFKSNLFWSLNRGYPAMLFYFTGEKTYTSEFKLTARNSNGKIEAKISPEIYVPLPDGEKSIGAHVVVVTGKFEFNGKKYVVISDPNEHNSQIWPVEFLDRVFSAKMIYWSFRED